MSNKLSRYILTLVALFAMTTGIWAQTTVTWDNNTWASGWTNDVKTHTVDGVTVTAAGIALVKNDNGNLYMAALSSGASVTFSADIPIARIEMTTATALSSLPLTPTDGWSVSSDGTSVIWEGTATKSLVCETCTLTVLKIKFFLEDAGTALTSTDGKVWTLDAMPAGNVELQVEYEPELTATFTAANDNTIEAGKATVSVKEGDSEAVAATLTDGKLTPLYENQKVILNATTGYKIRKVKAKKVATE